jgi:hypothetical protein
VIGNAVRAMQITTGDAEVTRDDEGTDKGKAAADHYREARGL